jgi:hypothetical protein
VNPNGRFTLDMNTHLDLGIAAQPRRPDDRDVRVGLAVASGRRSTIGAVAG